MYRFWYIVYVILELQKMSGILKTQYYDFIL